MNSSEYDMIGIMCKSANAEWVCDLKHSLKEKCKVYCEIGVLYGGSIIKMMDCPNECLHIGIDPFTGYYGNSYDPHRNIDLSKHQEIVEENIKKNNKHNQKWRLIAGDSTKKEIADKVTEKIDFLFIDGDHSKKAVLLDFENYESKVNVGGLIAFDNYNDCSWPGVLEACNEIQKEHCIENNPSGRYKEYCIYTNCLVLKKII